MPFKGTLTFVLVTHCLSEIGSRCHLEYKALMAWMGPWMVSYWSYFIGWNDDSVASTFDGAASSHG